MNCEAAHKILGKSVMTITRYCENGKLKAQKVPDSTSPKGYHWEIDAESVKNLAKENAVESCEEEIVENKKEEREKERKAAEEVSLDLLVSSLRLGPEQSERLKNLLAGFSKKRGEALLKAEQALAAQTKNLVESRELVSLKDLQEEFERIFGLFAKNLRDMIEVWSIEYKFSPQQSMKMRGEFDDVVRRTLDELSEHTT